MQDNTFNQIKEGILNFDPVNFSERYLTLDGAPFTLHNNGYKPFADIYRYIGIKALEKDAKPVILVKGRQVGATTMAVALEMYFMASGLFGINNKPPMRVIHCFPTLVHVYTYTKTKLNNMISSAVQAEGQGKNLKKSVIELKLDKSSPTNDSLQFKQFIGGNFLRVESTGLKADRLRGGTVDVIFYDECFPYDQYIETEDGKESIGALYDMWADNKSLPKVKTYNEITGIFEYKNIIKAWNRGDRSLVEIVCGNRKIKCTTNHRFLTECGWKRVDELHEGDLIKTTPANHLIIMG